MNKKQFIDKMLVKFMSNASTIQAKQLVEEYDQFLKPTLDFDYLYEKIVTEYNKRSAPQISELRQWYKTAAEYENKNTSSTWKIFAETKYGGKYEFHCFVSIPEAIGVSEFKKARPELIYCGNNYKEVVKYGY